MGEKYGLYLRKHEKEGGAKPLTVKSNPWAALLRLAVLAGNSAQASMLVFFSQRASTQPRNTTP